MTLLLIDWASVGVKAGQLLLSLSILVVLHEFGHYITARWFKCRVEKFYLFFDPWFSVIKKKIGDTEYGIGWLPLGGYVKIAGMIDESMDKEAMKLPPKEWEFRSKPAWQRLIIMLGGIIMNVIVAILIYAMVLQIWGEKKIPTESIKYGILVNDSSTLYKLGLRSGDKLVSVDGKKIDDFDNALKKILLVDNSIVVERKGKEINLNTPVDLIGQLIESKRKGKLSFIEARIPSIVFYVADTSNAYKSGLRKDDKLIQIDSTRVQFHDEIEGLLEQRKNQDVLVTVDRNGEEIPLKIKLSADGKIGFNPYSYSLHQMDSLGWLKIVETKYSFLASFPAAVNKGKEDLVFYVAQFAKILQPKTGAYKGLGGFKGIANVFGDSWNWELFWRMTAFLSIVLAFMNLLPIPALDGGHVMFTLYEMITRRKPNEKFLEYAQMAGMILLLLLMVYANANDWLGWGK